MSTHKSNTLKALVLKALETQLGKSSKIPGSFAIYRFGKARINLRVTTKKSGTKYWFDITPVLYEKSMVDFFVYACGSDQDIYVFPMGNMKEMVVNASIGGINSVPNFTIYTDRHDFEPAGHSESRIPIARYHNAMDLILSGNCVGKGVSCSIEPPAR
ncbi:hypothetical protein [Thiothrix sp.]|jgi:hypothetical protein|uniref:hypothetical protein n=1 Tax=Thiothrix sp. TaxID=1032 RepID=UPI00257D700E|nr:hypothetical protein [Thiothrix sp.]